MKPDDTTLALWLDDELEGEEFARVEAWAAAHPEQLAAREEIRRWRRMISGCIPRSIEPPAGEFFNQRILHAIEHQATPVAATRRAPRSWWLPLAACASMAAAFLLGYGLRDNGRPGEQAIAPVPAEAAPAIYTPAPGVQAEWRDNEISEAEVIILNGIEAISDSVEFNAQTGLPCQEDEPAADPPAAAPPK